MVFDQSARSGAGDSSSNNSAGLYNDLVTSLEDLQNRRKLDNLNLAWQDKKKQGPGHESDKTKGAEARDGAEDGDKTPGTSSTSEATPGGVPGLDPADEKPAPNGQGSPRETKPSIPPAPPVEAGAGRDVQVKSESGKAPDAAQGKLEKVDLSKIKDDDRQNFELLGISEMWRGSNPGSNPLEFGMDKKGDLKLVGLDNNGNSLINLNKGELDDKHGAGWHLMDKDGTLTPLPNANIKFSVKDGTFTHSGIPGLGKDPNRAYKTDYLNGTKSEGRFEDDGKGGRKFVPDVKEATAKNQPEQKQVGEKGTSTTSGIKSGTLRETLDKIRKDGQKNGLSEAEIAKQMADARVSLNEQKGEEKRQR